MIGLEGSLPPPLPSAPAELAPARGAPEPAAFRRVVDTLGARIDAGDALMQRALKGGLGELDPGALIAVQAGIYRYVEAVDLTAKLVDRAGTAVRTVLQSGSH